jgi:hypothetical protein
LAEVLVLGYTNEDYSCVWLGEGDATSAMAFKFIQKEVLQLQNFDELCDSKEASKKWGALLDLMQRQWFSRRWVVQEIALAREAVIYCGADKIPWKGVYFQYLSDAALIRIPVIDQKFDADFVSRLCSGGGAFRRS